MLTSYAASPMAKRKCERIKPRKDLAMIQSLQQETRDALTRIYRQGNLSFGGLKDIGASLKILEVQGTLGIKELLDIGSVLDVTLKARRYGDSEEASEVENDCLRSRFLELMPLEHLGTEIHRCILSETEIADDASSGLKSVRRNKKLTNEQIHQQLAKLVGDQANQVMFQDNLVTMRNGRYCIPVKAEYKNSFSGMIHDQSGTGSTVFIEPMAVVNLNNKLKELENQEILEIEKILESLSAQAASELEYIKFNYETLTELDFIFARANFAKSYKGSEPVFNTEGIIDIKQGRHPLLDKHKVVPVDIKLGENYNLLIVTGPNTGGKTVSLKTLGLFTLMGQSGLHIPALDGSRLNVFDDVFADIGDEQSIEQNLSTFSSHMSNIVYIMNHVTPNTLCLFDELGGGTDPVEGAALAMSILGHLNDMGVRCMATTHYSELKTFAMSTPGVENASCEFDVATLMPTYRLMIGIPGKSNAFAISKKLGLPDYIIDRARENIDSNTVDFETLISELEKSKLEIDRDKEEIARYKEEARQLTERANIKDSEIRAKKTELLAEARQEAADIIEEAKAVADDAIKKYNKWSTNPNKADARTMENERRKLRTKMDDYRKMDEVKRKSLKSEHVASDFKTGDTVHVISMDTTGTIIAPADSKGNLKVQMGILSSLLPASDLVIIDAPKQDNKASVSNKRGMSKALSIQPEINVLGMTVAEATSLIDRYLDDAMLAHLHKVTIIHGKGTGALRKGIHEYLKKQSYVKSFRLGEYGEGEAGVTVVEL
jgi:DNA mismatch repair protein MutS2